MSNVLKFNLQYGHMPTIESCAIQMQDPDVIRKQSVCRVTEGTAYDKNVPKFNGIHDPRMGTTDSMYNCATCGNRVMVCNGHPGHIEFYYPIYHYKFILLVSRLLNCMCFNCYNLRAVHDFAKFKNLEGLHGEERLQAVHNILSKIKECQHCKAPQPTFIHNVDKIRIDRHFDHDELFVEYFGESVYQDLRRQVFTSREARLMLKEMLPNDYEFLGFKYARTKDDSYLGKTQPHWFILENMAVIPPCVRPAFSEVQGSKNKGEDNITRRIVFIVKANEEIRQYLDSQGVNPTFGANLCTVNIPMDLISNLQFTHAAYISKKVRKEKVGLNGKLLSNKTKTLHSKLKQNEKGLEDRLRGKQGRFRSSLNGKRSNNSARSVIDPDTSLDLNEVSLPIAYASELVYPERVTPFNIERLQKCVNIGAYNKGGACYVVDNYDKVLYLESFAEYDQVGSKENKAVVQLEVGFEVGRYITEEVDSIMENRQPTLRNVSSMSHKVRFNNSHTTKIETNVTDAYAGDFDGDEMNGHLPGNPLAMAELKELMSVENNIVNIQSGKPVISLKLDFLTGSFLLTRRDTYLTKQEFMQIMMIIKENENQTWRLPQPHILKKNELTGQFDPYWSGKQVLSYILKQSCSKPFFYFKSSTKDVKTDRNESWGEQLFNNHDSVVAIRDNEVLSGHFTKDIVGKGTDTIHQFIFHDQGGKAAHDFLTNLKNVAAHYLEHRQISVGMDDIVLNSKVHDQIAEAYERVRKTIRSTVDLWDETYVNKDQRSLNEIERYIQGVLQNYTQFSQATVENNVSVNRNQLYLMNYCGAKGSITETSQITTQVGQQFIDGQRIMQLKPELYTERLLPNQPFEVPLWDLRSRGFVENGFTNGLEPDEQFVTSMTGREGIISVIVKTSEGGYIQRKIRSATEDLSVKYDRTVRDENDTIVQFRYGGDNLNPMYTERIDTPYLAWSNQKVRESFWLTKEECKSSHQFRYMVLLDKYYRNVRQSIQKCRINPLSTCDASQVLSVVPIHRRIITMLSGRKINDNTHMTSADYYTALETRLEKLHKEMSRNGICQSFNQFEFLLVSECNPRNVILKWNLTFEEWEQWLEKFCLEYDQKCIQPGEMVGAESSGSIAEPALQMSLSNPHTAGSNMETINTGIPRCKEILDLSKKVKNPKMTLFLKPEYNKNEKFVQQLAKRLISCPLKTICYSNYIKSVESIYNMSQAFRDCFDLHSLFVPQLTSASEECVIFMEMNVKLMKELDITGEQIMNQIRLYIESLSPKQKSLGYVFGFDSYVFVHIYDLKGVNHDWTVKSLAKVSDVLLSTVHISGHEQILKTFVKSVKTKKLNKQTGAIDEEPEFIITTEGVCGKSTSKSSTSCGSGLLEMMLCPYLDSSRSYSNNIHEMYQIFGVEVVNQLISFELFRVITLETSYVDPHHFWLCADIMSVQGILTAMNRHGHVKTENGILKRASFEETTDILKNGAAFSAVDHMRGVTEKVIFGQTAKIGTGIVTLLVDSEADWVQDQIKAVPTITTKYLDSCSILNANQLQQPTQIQIQPPSTQPFVKIRVCGFENVSDPNEEQFTPMSPGLVA